MRARINAALQQLAIDEEMYPRGAFIPAVLVEIADKNGFPDTIDEKRVIEAMRFPK